MTIVWEIEAQLPGWTMRLRRPGTKKAQNGRNLLLLCTAPLEFG